ncbi:hypothetical protein ACFWXH_13885 [Mesorhizobium sp. NPDC059054]|uniref:hypothetical protein n=1 Tax=Mesorhizobium sp. NPDC059054 TaxID=3346711 RepID=UPI0036B63E03
MYIASAILFLVPFVLILAMPGWRSLCAVAAVLALIAAAYWAWGYYQAGGDSFEIVFLFFTVLPWVAGCVAGVVAKSALLWWRGRMQAAS